MEKGTNSPTSEDLEVTLLCRMVSVVVIVSAFLLPWLLSDEFTKARKFVGERSRH